MAGWNTYGCAGIGIQLHSLSPLVAMTLMVYYSLIPLPLQIAVVANFAFLQKHVESITVALAWTVGFAWTNLLSMVGHGMGGRTVSVQAFRSSH